MKLLTAPGILGPDFPYYSVTFMQSVFLKYKLYIFMQIILIQEIDGSVKSGKGDGPSATETAKKRELDTSNVEKVLHCY